MSHSLRLSGLAGPRTWALAAVLAGALFFSACGPVYVQDDGYGGYGHHGSYGAAANVGYQGGGQVDFSYLSSYGIWTNASQYGRVWVPNANRTAGWRPYFYGRWDYSDYGWTWASDEAWGWGPYHYGRWAWDARLRWVWVPGTVWGPAWVTWRTGGNYVGWAPLGPRGVVYNHSTYWTFIDQRYIYRRPVHTLVIRPSQVSVVFGRTRRINHVSRIRTRSGRVVRYNAGPRRTTVQTWTRTRIQPRRISTIRGATPRRGPSARVRGGGRTRTGRSYRPAPGRTYRPTNRVAPTRGRSPAAYRPAPGRAYRPAPRRGRDAAPSRGYRSAPTRSAPSRGAPSRGYRAAPSRGGRAAPSRGYRPAPGRAYRPAPSRSRASAGRAAPGRAAPTYGRSSSPYRSAPRAAPRARSSSRSSRSSRSRAAPSRSRSSSRSRSAPSRRSSSRRSPRRAR